MKKLIYGLVILTTMLCLMGCKPEPADSTGSDSSSPTSDPGEPAKEPTVDTTTLDG